MAVGTLITSAIGDRRHESFVGDCGILLPSRGRRRDSQSKGGYSSVVMRVASENDGAHRRPGGAAVWLKGSVIVDRVLRSLRPHFVCHGGYIGGATHKPVQKYAGLIVNFSIHNRVK